MNRRNLMQTAVAVATLATPAMAAEPSRPAAARRVVTRDGLELSHADWGTGQPVVFVNSWATNSQLWNHQIPALTEAGYRCVTFDRRGHGRSHDTGRGYDIDTLSDDLGAVLDQLDLHGVTLVAHSMGACEVVRYLSRHGSGRVARMALLAPTTPFLLQTADNPAGIPKAALEMVRSAWQADFPKWVADNTAPFFTPATSPETMAWGARMMLECPVPVALATNRAVAEVDFRPDLAKVRLPTLILHGDVDASAPLELCGRGTAAMIAGSRLVVLKGAPHGLMITHPEAVNRALLEFIQA